MITIQELKVKYGDKVALTIDEPILIEPNDRIGVIGSNGAGKTTLVNAILGLIPYHGTILRDVHPSEMGVHLQFNEYTSTVPIWMVMEAILNTDLKSNALVNELIDFFDFRECLKKRYGKLSGGQKQRLTLILVLSQDYKILFFDEVTSGLDFETRQRLIDLLVKWYSEKETTLCMISHYYQELSALVDKILLLDEGNVIEYGDRQDLFRKYCGRTILICDNNPVNRQLTSPFPILKSAEHMIAVKCIDEQTEAEAVKILQAANVDYIRSSDDIEIMSINAKERYYATHTQGN